MLDLADCVRKSLVARCAATVARSWKVDVFSDFISEEQKMPSFILSRGTGVNID